MGAFFSLSFSPPMVVVFMTWIPCSSFLTPSSNKNCFTVFFFFTSFQSFKERNNIMGDYIFWLAVYPFLKEYFLSRVTLLFPAIFFFRLLSFCTSSCWRLPIWCVRQKNFCYLLRATSIEEEFLSSSWGVSIYFSR